MPNATPAPQTTFSDVVSSGWMYFNPSGLTWWNILLSLMLAFGVGTFIYWVYHHTYRGVLYNRTFGITLVLMTVITTPVVMCIKSNIALSMGMVGALSIVRFRTAVKDPLDIAYLFWSLTMGILLGAGQFFMAILSTAGIAVLAFVLNYVAFAAPNSYLLVLHYEEYAEPDVEGLLRRMRYQKLKSKTITRAGAEMTIEVRVENTSRLVSDMLNIQGVHDATLVAYQGETA